MKTITYFYHSVRHLSDSDTRGSILHLANQNDTLFVRHKPNIVKHLFTYCLLPTASHLLFTAFCLLLLLPISTLTTFSQNATIKGKITDAESKETLVGVNIILDEQTGTASDIDGNYLISVPPGKVKLTYTFIGYQKEIKTIDVKPAEILVVDVKLYPETEILNEVVVSAGRFEQKLSDVNVSMAVIKPTMILSTNALSLDETLNKIPGVNMIENQMNIRGGSGYSYGTGSRVQVLVDGLPLISPDAGDVKWTFVPIENISQVEILKGASSVLYGSSALNGIVNIRTAFPENKPQTKVNAFTGLYMNPQRKELIWWGNTQPLFAGADFLHTRKIENIDLVVGANVFTDNNYKEYTGEERARFNMNFRYRPKNIKTLSCGVNTNMMWVDDREFFMWLNDSSGGWRMDSSNITTNKGFRMNIDPYVTYYDDKGNQHTLKTRFYLLESNIKEDESKNQYSENYYAEYQYQKNIREDFTWTLGLTGAYSEIEAQLYGNHFSNNVAFFSQFDKKFRRFSFSVGLRGEYFRIDTAETVSTYDIIMRGDTFKLLFQPVFRSGVNYQLSKSTFLRASFGQGYRFPSVAEKFTHTNVGGLNIFPNPKLQPERGWSAEIGAKQGVKISRWNGYLDIAGFWSKYFNMMEYTFGAYNDSTFEVFDTTGGVFPNPKDNFGFKCLNIGQAQIYGIDISFTGQGKFFGIPATLLIGYTYINPINLSDTTTIKKQTHLDLIERSNYLKYRSKHSAKGDIELNYKKISSGISFVYNSKILSIDSLFLDPFINTIQPILPGFPDYWKKYNKGYIVFDYRISYQFSLNSKISIILKNVFNKEYMGRPGDIRPPRNIAFQYSLMF